MDASGFPAIKATLTHVNLQAGVMVNFPARGAVFPDIALENGYPIPLSTVWRIHAGGPAYTDSLGNFWMADAQFAGELNRLHAECRCRDIRSKTISRPNAGAALSPIPCNVPDGNYQVALEI